MRLLDNVGLEVSAQRLLKEVMCVLDGLNGLPRLGLRGLHISATGKIVHAYKLFGEPVKYRGELAGCGILVVLGVVGGDDIHVALKQTASLLRIIGSIDPGVIANRNPLWQLHLGHFGLDSGMVQAQLLHLEHLIYINMGLDTLAHS